MKPLERIAFHRLKVWQTARRPWAIAGLIALLWGGPALADNRALLIGVGRYQHLEEPLPGIDQDLQMMEEVVTAFGFGDDEIRTLAHEEATLSGIRSAIQTWLIAGTAPQDRAFLYFTGHGTLVEDKHPRDEDDANDEALLTHDFREVSLHGGGSRMENLLVDDELARLLARIPAREVVVMVDACHSGTVTRSVHRQPGKFYDYPGAPRGRHSSVVDSSSIERPSVVLLSAARSEEEAQTSTHGALFTQGVHRAVLEAQDQQRLGLEELRRATEDFIHWAVGAERDKIHRPDLSGAKHLRSLNLFLPRRFERPTQAPATDQRPSI